MISSDVRAAEFGSLLRNYRTRAGITQSELAGLAVVSLRTIRNLESGRTASPRSETVRLLADGLRLTTESRAKLSLAAGQSPLCAALSAAQGRLPGAGGSFRKDPLGRDDDIRRVLQTVRTNTSRLISISGFGGVGKSQLAVAVAQEAQRTLRMPWLWLRKTETRESVSGSATDAVFAEWNRELADGQLDAAEELARMIGEQTFMLIVDDAPGTDDRLHTALRWILDQCPRVFIIETTRRPRQRDGRQIIALEPLSVPFPGSAVPLNRHGYPARQLFLPFVKAVCPDLEESEENLQRILEVCWSLDGLPRALEAAASWFAFYPPALVAQMAGEDPAALAAPQEEDGMDNWLTGAFNDALECLTNRQLDLLLRLAPRPVPWTLDELAAEWLGGSGSLVECVHGLLTAGLVRPAQTDAGDRAFTVLNLVRHALS